MWLPRKVIDDVRQVARIHYVSVTETKAWNDHRKDGELRLLTGWEWIARDGSSFRGGFKTETVCFRDAWYALVAQAEAPRVTRLRVVSSRRVA
jgi:hypothetical protein